MISSILFIFQSLNDLRKLPGPAEVLQASYFKSNTGKYREVLTRTEVILKTFDKLNADEKSKYIRKFYASVKSDHTSLSKRNLNPFEIYRKYELDDQMKACDLAKIDALFLRSGLKPLFHTEDWLRRVYSVTTPTGFNIVPRDSIITPFGATTGLPPEPRTTSFDTFSGPEVRILLTWLSGKSNLKQLPIMSQQKMMSRIDKYMRN